MSIGIYDAKRAALDLDLGRPVKHAGRNSAGIWGVNRQGCRFSRPAPWMARGGGPPNHCRITGTPSLGEVPSVGARALCLLWGFSKVSRRKGGTLSGRDRSNGYVHLNDKYRLPVRLRRHASGHLIPRGALRFFASMLAPTEGTRMASNQAGRSAASLLIVIWLLIFLPPREAEWRFCAVGKPARMPV